MRGHPPKLTFWMHRSPVGVQAAEHGGMAERQRIRQLRLQIALGLVELAAVEQRTGQVVPDLQPVQHRRGEWLQQAQGLGGQVARAGEVADLEG